MFQLLECSRNTLLDHLQPIFTSTYGIIFLGTPHRGSGKASLGDVATSILKAFGHDANSSLVRDLRADSQTLERVADAFSRMLAMEKIKVHSFYEELGLTNVVGIRKVWQRISYQRRCGLTTNGQVVEESSATIGDAREGKEGIHGNHKTMTKFVSATDSEYRKVSDVIWRFVKNAAAAAQATMTTSDERE